MCGRTSPGGTSQPPEYVGWLVRNPVPLQELCKLLFKTLLLAVSPLVLDVTHDIGSLRSAYAEGAVSLLPSKRLTGFIDPLARASLEELKGFCSGKVGGRTRSACT
jgi:hypothetical protein